MDPDPRLADPVDIPAEHARPDPDPGLPAALTVGAVARQLGCSPMHISRLIRAGEIPAIDIGLPNASREYPRILPSDLADFLARRAARLNRLGSAEGPGQ